MKSKTILLVMIGLIALFAIFMWRHGSPNMPHMSGGPHMMGHNNQPLASKDGLVIPETLSDPAKKGQFLFEAKCVVCHGKNAVGQIGNGPPLIHKIYEPSHHADEAFQRAVANGVRSHHWPFGNMPPVPGLTRLDVEKIISYVRELQRANGIE